ncbi:MAG: flagellar hook-basal body complex protein FliE [Inquilinus sp.]|nr:flagellar hook-basal body complex protein FliE [Inquilinus sp.]
MVARLTDATAAYTAAGKANGPGMEARDGAAEGAFGDLVRDLIGDTAAAGAASEKVATEALAGQADLAEVVMAVNNAELTLQTVVAIRDKVIEAYQEIIRMPI